MYPKRVGGFCAFSRLVARRGGTGIGSGVGEEGVVKSGGRIWKLGLGGGGEFGLEFPSKCKNNYIHRCKILLYFVLHLNTQYSNLNV